jgi:MinD-like ATPase involved in chromosome partitioning or flagellar assembly
MTPPNLQEMQKKIVVVYSLGGGNGKSEIAANLAYCLAEQGMKAWIVDANLYAPTQDLIFGLPAAGASLSDFLISPAGSDIPYCDVTSKLAGKGSGRLLLTPSNRDDQDVRFSLQEILNRGTDFSHILPEALFRGMHSTGADILIIDTYPTFEQINEVWLGLTNVLLIISRINELDLENTRMFLRQGTVEDITNKLIVLNNIRLDKDRNVFHDIENQDVSERLAEIRRQAACVIQSDHKDKSSSDGPCDAVIYDEPILYSEKLSIFRQNMRKRDGLFIQKEPTDSFSVSIWNLAEYINAKTAAR